MIFSPDLAAKVLDGTKTQTRRRAEYELAPRYVPGRTYAVQTGRGKPAVGRVRVLEVTREPVRAISDADARAEGFGSPEEFFDRWRTMHGQVRGHCWRIVFALAEG